MAPGDLITRDGQIEFNGLLMGAGTPYGNLKLQGWHDMSLTLGNKPRNNRHGSYPGKARQPERAITWDFKMWPDRPGFVAAHDALERATEIPQGATELPLVIRTRGTPWMVHAKCDTRLLPADRLFYAGVPEGTLRWIASDPRRMELTERTATIAAATAAVGGLPYPLVYPLDYGTPGAPSSAVCTNFGTVETHPVLTFVGPINQPRVLNSTLGRQLEFGIDLLLGQTLTIDTAANTVLLNGVTDRLYTRTDRSVPAELFWFARGDNVLTLLAAEIGGPPAKLTITWRSARS